MVTMQDIADSANVSRGTVSYVLNGKYKQAKISKTTRDRIMTVAEELGYRRNAIAQSMKTGKTNVIGFVGGLYSSYCMKIIKGINDIASKHNYMLKLLPTEKIEQVKNVARQCVEQRLAGVICRSLTEEELEIMRKELEPNNIPIVLVDSSFYHNWCSRVISDDFEGAKIATEYLLKLGHRKISFVTNELNRGFAKLRYDGYAQMMSNWGVKVKKEDISFISFGAEISSIQKADIKRLLIDKQPTGVFCSSDPLAMKVIAVAYEMGIKVPEQLSVMGYGNLEYSGYSSPPLTSINQPFVDMGIKASEILLNALNQPEPPQEVKLPVKLIVRSSVQAIK